MLCLQWLFGVVLGRTGSRYIDTPASDAARLAPANRAESQPGSIGHAA
jgi:hypothetical protein